MSRRPVVIDLFAGAGGFSLAAELVGADVTHAFEIDQWASQTLQKNHSDTRVITSDIQRVTNSWIRGNIESNPDIIIGGPPCQGFSQAGPARKDPKDPRNSLFREFLRFVRVLNPETAILENVPGLLKAVTSAGKPVPEVITAEFEKLGFDVSILILDAHRYGVPQIRRRVFFVASQSNSSTLPPIPTHGDPDGDLFRQPRLPLVTVRDAISDLPIVDVGDADDGLPYATPPIHPFQKVMRKAAPALIANHHPMRHTARMIERFRSISPGQSQSDAPPEHAPRRRMRSETAVASYDQNNRRMHWDRPCHTIAASFYANFLHPELHRNFTPREGARIQSFPDRYVFCGKPTVVSSKLLEREGRTAERYLSQYNQIGNAVPPLLGAAVLRQVLRKDSPTKRETTATPEAALSAASPR